MKTAEQIKTIKEAIGKMKESGCTAHVISESAEIRLVFDRIRIEYDSIKGLKVIAFDDDHEIDISNDCRLQTIGFNFQYPVILLRIQEPGALFPSEKVNQKRQLKRTI